MAGRAARADASEIEDSICDKNDGLSEIFRNKIYISKDMDDVV